MRDCSDLMYGIEVDRSDVTGIWCLVLPCMGRNSSIACCDIRVWYWLVIYCIPDIVWCKNLIDPLLLSLVLCLQIQQRGRLLTVFSSSGYCGGSNDAACVLVESRKIRIVGLDTTWGSQPLSLSIQPTICKTTHRRCLYACFLALELYCYIDSDCIFSTPSTCILLFSCSDQITEKTCIIMLVVFLFICTKASFHLNVVYSVL